jgi:hypothetical protein
MREEVFSTLTDGCRLYNKHAEMDRNGHVVFGWVVFEILSLPSR